MPRCFVSLLCLGECVFWMPFILLVNAKSLCFCCEKFIWSLPVSFSLCPTCLFLTFLLLGIDATSMPQVITQLVQLTQQQQQQQGQQPPTSTQQAANQAAILQALALAQQQSSSSLVSSVSLVCIPCRLCSLLCLCVLLMLYPHVASTPSSCFTSYCIRLY